ncbi:CHC2 zinc finger domain-containing protein [Roseibacillus ishigakijimensis]|uniref:Zinc finger CHC2-type domain-containing protein n=1 Tax=Roseibacillus ishigakijimensis TaxID=454146 RepID=A0A934RU24_9BACT|nr:CHC2 zinc finger domain-containing protein [Roseibacillus ishigakijimensis]MBK1835676.1 hypothetical protein [Roseibacillus ishigakijimensis]
MNATTDYTARRAELKERYRIPDAWRDLGYEDQPAKSCRCPWRDDRKPSFSVYDDGRAFKDFSTDESGDVISFARLALGVSFKEAVRWCEERAGIRCQGDYPARPLPLPPRRPSPEKPRKELKLPELDEGRPEDLAALARVRGLARHAIKPAIQIGVLRFGQVCGKRSWILLDDSGLVAEARRLDGKPFDAFKRLPERKAHTLAGSRKDWPLGLTMGTMELEGETVAKFRHDTTILLVEGGPDYLAALDFMGRDLSKKGLQPVAMLGKSNRITSEALDVMAGRRVRIYPHTDGMEAAAGWAAQLAGVGCKVDGFRFDGLTRKDGQPVTDLNDLLLADEASREAWKGVLP